MQTVWIIGAGTFGQLAVKRLEKRFRIILIDPDASMLESINSPRIMKIVDNGIDFLARNLHKSTDVSFIVPCLPVHLAWEWCHKKLGSDALRLEVLPDTLDALLPNPMRGQDSHIYVSHADFICPENCSEPDALCTHTGHPRKKDMHQLLAGIVFQDYQPQVLQSRQLAPGVGGYSPQQLFTLLEKIKNVRGSLMICTACRCHGVVTGVAR